MEKFGKVIEHLRKEGMARRASWEPGREIVAHRDTGVRREYVPMMTSLPETAKAKIGRSGSGEITFDNQVLIIRFQDGAKPAEATGYTPTWDDIFAEDWVLL